MVKKQLGKFKASMILSAIGDALGWPFEFAKRKPKEEIKSFIKWKKNFGGKWWGYEDEVGAGEYSDDTQLMLAVARSVIRGKGRFEPEYFAYYELPFWLKYGRGGGESIKSAARNLEKVKVYWYKNFYSTKEVDYFNAGGSGSAMRNLAIALVNSNNEEQFIIDTIKNALITHGHPRGIIGGIIIGAAQMYLLNGKDPNDEMLKYIKEIIEKSSEALKKGKDKEIKDWLNAIEIERKYTMDEFLNNYLKHIEEPVEYIRNIPNFLKRDIDDYYSFTKAKEEFKGSGISTTCVAIYLFKKYSENPTEALIQAVNAIGSDTDTIANFVGSLIGTYIGEEYLSDNLLKELANQVQDKDYLEELAQELWKKHTESSQMDECLKMRKGEKSDNRKEFIKEIRNWSERLNELKENDIVHPPTPLREFLGKGTILAIKDKEIKNKPNYIAKIYKIKFDCGQTADFHYRVNKDHY